MMKLYKLDNSPFAARIRMQIRHKGLNIEVCEPSETLRTPEFRAAYPLGKIPALELGNGDMIGESTAIMNYLETCFPERPMLPQDPLDRAHNEMLIRYVDNHLPMALSPIFLEFFGIVHQQNTVKEFPSRFDALHLELDKLNKLLDSLPSFTERSLQTGDLCLAAHLYYVIELSAYFGGANIVDGYDHIKAWQNWVEQYPAVVDTVHEMDVSHQVVVEKTRNR